MSETTKQADWEELMATFGKPETRELLRNLAIAGGAGGLGGAVLSSLRGRVRGEDRGDRRRRIVRDALMGAGLAAGGYGLVTSGANQLSNALEADDVSPGARWLNDPRTRGGMAFLGGGLAHNRITGPRKADTARKFVQQMKEMGAVDKSYVEMFNRGKPIPSLKATLKGTKGMQVADKLRGTPLARELARAGYRMPSANSAPFWKRLGGGIKSAPGRAVWKTVRNAPTLAAALAAGFAPELFGAAGRAYESAGNFFDKE